MFRHDLEHTGQSQYAGSQKGTLSWSYVTGDDVLSSPAIGGNGALHAGSRDNRLYSLTSAGAFSWSYMAGDNVNSSPAIGSDGAVYMGSTDNRLYSITSAGAFSWSYVTGERIWGAPAIGSDRALYAGSDDNRLYSLTSTGALSWSYVTVGDVLSSPAIGSDGTVYVGSHDNRLYSLTSAGAFSWSYVTGGNVQSSPAIGSDGALHVGSYDNRLYCFQDPLKKLAILKKEGAGDVNLYYYKSLVDGDRTYWDCDARNPSAYARDMWIIPTGNDAIGMTAAAGAIADRLCVMKKEGAGDVNLYLYNSIVGGDWTYWDCDARNPSSVARDLWIMPVGNDAIGIATVEDMNADGLDDLAILKKEGAGDVNLYYYNALVPGDWIYWDCYARNPSALARDLWIIPVGNDAVGMTAVRTE